jgi:ureidoglycolate hydrolase
LCYVAFCREAFDSICDVVDEAECQMVDANSGEFEEITVVVKV